MVQLLSKSSAILYCSLLSKTLPLCSPDTLAKNLPRGVQKDKPMFLSAQAFIKAGVAPIYENEMMLCNVVPRHFEVAAYCKNTAN